jgi:hypothetical protein
MLAGGRTTWTAGERVRVYRATRGRSRLMPEVDGDLEPADSAGPDDAASNNLAASPSPRDPRDYDVEHYLRVLRDTFASRFARALTPEDFATVFADPEQPDLFARPLDNARPILTTIVQPPPNDNNDDDDSPDALHDLHGHG